MRGCAGDRFGALKIVRAIAFHPGDIAGRYVVGGLRVPTGERLSEPGGRDLPGAVDHTLLVATTRERDPRPGTLFNGERASAVDYAE